MDKFIRKLIDISKGLDIIDISRKLIHYNRIIFYDRANIKVYKNDIPTYWGSWGFLCYTPLNLDHSEFNISKNLKGIKITLENEEIRKNIRLKEDIEKFLEIHEKMVNSRGADEVITIPLTKKIKFKGNVYIKEILYYLRYSNIYFKNKDKKFFIYDLSERIQKEIEKDKKNIVKVFKKEMSIIEKEQKKIIELFNEKFLKYITIYNLSKDTKRSAYGRNY